MAKTPSKKVSKKKTAKKPAQKPVKKSAAKRGGRAVDAMDDPKRSLTFPPPVEPGQILGQERALDVLRSAMTSGRLHHAWIFHGPAGVGKFTAAMTFVAALLDPDAGLGVSAVDDGPALFGGGEPEPAEGAAEAGGDPLVVDAKSECQTLIRAGTHPDLHVIVKELARFHDDKKVRDAKLASIPKAVIDDHLLHPASLAPANDLGGLAGKVFIIDEAELLDRSPTNAPVQNALLKTLEEPPERTVFVLVTSSEDRLLPTIRSRAQRVAFTPLTKPDMTAWLGTRQLGLDPDEASWYVDFASGSPGLLVRAVEAGLAEWSSRLSPMLARADEGSGDAALGRTMADLANDWAGAWVKTGEKIGEARSKEAANRAGAALVLAVVAHRYRGQLRRGERAEHAVEVIDAIELANRRVASNVQMVFAFEALAADIARATVLV